MVTVDMSTTRAQITKRQRRMRRAAQRRLRRQQNAQLRAIHIAEAARESRQRAIASWNAEEERLHRLRDTQQTTPNQQNHNGQTPQEKRRAVKFAEQVMVTEIPLCDTDKLPKPVSSPIGVSICGTDDDSDSESDSSNQPSKSITFSQLAEGAFADDSDDDDPEFAPDDPFMLKVSSCPIQRPRRRIAAKRLDVSLENIIPSKCTKRSKLNHTPKRPRPETHQSSGPSSIRTPSPSQQSETKDPQIDDKCMPDETSSEEEKQAKQRRSSIDASSLARLRNKRKRLRSARNGEQEENEQQTANVVSESREKTGSTATQFHEYTNETYEKPTRTKKMRPSPERRAFNDKSEKALLTSSSGKVVGRDLPSVQNGKARSAPKNGEVSCTSNGHSKQNSRKLNGVHNMLASKEQNSMDREDEKDLDDMFGNLIKLKAANRVLKEKMSLQEKRQREENDLQQNDQPNKKFKKVPSRYTEDGLRIMTYEEIAADQPPGLNGDCPFDCSCCF